MRFVSYAFAGVLGFTGLCSQGAWASNLSFTGNFTHDDDLQLIYFTVDATSPVSFQTLSYAGGTNAASASIAPGGFDPTLSLFKYSGDKLQLGANDDGGCGLVGSDGGACLDSFLSAGPLTPGNYVLALTESPNSALGPTLADGFALSGSGDFSCPMFIGTPGPFCDSTLRQRDSHWAVDILGADSASLGAPPAFSFTGTFAHDDQISLYDIQLLQAATVTFRTLGYAGGINANTLPISAGGFDPFLSLFDASGAQFQLVANDDCGCFDVPADPNGACLDSLMVSPLLPAGDYKLALTESPNTALGPTLSDGFAFSGAGDYTCAMFLGTSGPFCDSTLSQRDGHFALDVYGADSVTPEGSAATVPEPANFLLVLSACAAGWLRRSRGCSKPW
jgi:hypothetical protein